MCDSDDTDVLLLIPPDFFVVPSSDESVENASKFAYKPLESTFVNTLAAQVNLLQNRLSFIESQSESVKSIENSFCKSPSKYHKEQTPPRHRRRLLQHGVTRKLSPVMSNESVKNVKTSSAQTTPKKPLHRLRQNKFLSSPSTATDVDDAYPDGKENVQMKRQSPACSILTTRYDPSGNSFDSLNISFSPPKRRGACLSLKELDARYQTNQQSPKDQNVLDSSDEVSSSTIDTEIFHLSKDRKVLSDIQVFLRSVESIKSHLLGKMDTGDSSLDLSFLTSPQFKAITQKHFNRKIIGLNHNKKAKKSKVSKLNSPTKICPDTSDANKISDTETPLNVTNDSTISLMESCKDINTIPNNNTENNLNDKTNACKAIQDALYLISNLKYTKEQTGQNVPENKSTTKTTFYQENYSIDKWKNRQKQFEQAVNENTSINLKKIEETISDQAATFGNEINTAADQEKLFETSAKSDNCTNKLPNIALLSLSSLWDKQNNKTDLKINDATHTSSVISKIEEERYRREHCEKLIEALQVRLLESQEKLTVAIKVDAAKDEAIEKLKDTCLVAQKRCEQYEIERNKALEEVEKIKIDSEKKIKCYEEEINKALSIARDSQNQTSELYENVEILKIDLEKSLNENKILSEKICQLQKHIDEDKIIMSEIRNAAAETKHIVTTSQTEVKQLKHEKEILERQLMDEKQNFSKLEEDKKLIENLLEDSKMNEKKLVLEKENLTADIERVRTELHTFYQRQVETVVKEKLAEFQEQLDTAEKTFQNDLITTKLQVAQTAAEFMRDTVDKHKLEIKLLEERHSEELKLCYLKRQQTEMIVENLRRKLHHQNINRAKLASKLHDLMETQWREAIRIVSTNGTLSPGSGSEISIMKPDSIMNIQKLLGDELNMNDDSEKCSFDPKFDLHKLQQKRPHSAPNELPTSDKIKGTSNQLKHSENVTDFRKLSDLQSVISSDITDKPFEKDGQLTYRRSDAPRNCSESNPTPLSSRNQILKNVTVDNDLQKYMKMLLGKDDVPYFTNDLASGDYKSVEAVEFSSGKNSTDHNKIYSSKSHHHNKNSKPPWK